MREFTLKWVKCAHHTHTNKHKQANHAILTIIDISFPTAPPSAQVLLDFLATFLISACIVVTVDCFSTPQQQQQQHSFVRLAGVFNSCVRWPYTEHFLARETRAHTHNCAFYLIESLAFAWWNMRTHINCVYCVLLVR